MPEIEGKLEEFAEVGSGKKKDGTEWIRYKYKVGDKTLSGFIDIKKKEPPLKVGDNVLVSYTVTQDGEKHYNNLQNIEGTVGKEEIEESNKQYNMTSVGGEKPPTPPDFNGSFFGMIWNSTLKWIINERNKQEKDYTFDEHFEEIFEHFWKKATEKRKEKGG